MALGAGAYLALIGAQQSFYTHAGDSSMSETWTTPKELLEPLYSVFGVFDLDPRLSHLLVLLIKLSVLLEDIHRGHTTMNKKGSRRGS